MSSLRRALMIVVLCCTATIGPVALSGGVGAHPGNTDGAGCHTCRTNCASWGLRPGQYHCHNGGGSSGGGSTATTAPPPPRNPTQGEISSVRRLYLAYFERESDAGGLAYWSNLHANGRTLSAISGEFAASAEFRARYGELDNAAFVTLVYNNVLGRSPDAGGLAHWLDMMRQGRSRGWVMIGFSESAEFRSKTGIG